ncbi:MAG TPA: zinc-binding dehydrogenase [Vicinamibacterales bacterium]|jgi:NADPH:quinone reductase-like Zn-dependent oxidoreductase|nr:zinc-binding dehydrogenase [Vicinamibacterales bacterium]
MKAVRFHQHGGPEVLRYEDAPDPVLSPGDVLVRVRGCALNRLDLWERRGLPKVKIALPHISGSDVAGEIVASAVPDVVPGRRVMLQPGISCGRCTACLSGRDNECPQYDVLGYRNHDGGYAELVRVPAQNLVSIPDNIDFTLAAAFPLTFLTAWHMLITRAHLKRGDDVLILAAGSGVGQAAIQIAFLHGARVFATAGSEEKLERARTLGAYEVIHHHKQDIVEEIRRFTNRRGVDIVIEHVGEATWAKSVRALARGGRLVTCGATTGANGVIDLAVLFSRQLSILGSYMGTKGELLRAARAFFAGQLKPVIDCTFTLADAAAAHQRMEASGQFGKIVLDVP